MRSKMYRYTIFKGKKPWKGMFDELDFMNQFSAEFDHCMRRNDKRTGDWSNKSGKEFTIYRFFINYCPAKWNPEKHGYESMFEEYIKGLSETEGGIVCQIDWDDLSTANKKWFYQCKRYWDGFFERYNATGKFEQPHFGVSRGTGNLEEIPTEKMSFRNDKLYWRSLYKEGGKDE